MTFQSASSSAGSDLDRLSGFITELFSVDTSNVSSTAVGVTYTRRESSFGKIPPSASLNGSSSSQGQMQGTNARRCTPSIGIHSAPLHLCR